MTPYSARMQAPAQFSEKLIPPAQLQHYTDHAARARKIKGFSQEGLPCFYFHSYSMLESRIDCDDCAYELIVYFEQVVAWRLDDGHWIQKKIQAHHPVCSPSHQQLQEFEIVKDCEWI